MRRLLEKTLEISERFPPVYGWIDEDGEYIPLSGRETHYDYLRRIADVDLLFDRDNDIAKAAALDLIRITSSARGDVDVELFKADATKAQIRALKHYAQVSTDFYWEAPNEEGEDIQSLRKLVGK